MNFVRLNKSDMLEKLYIERYINMEENCGDDSNELRFWDAICENYSSPLLFDVITMSEQVVDLA